MKTLLLMRHGKSDWSADYETDHDRPLNERGVKSSRVIGEVLSENDRRPELVVTSSAVRARTTAQLAVEAGGWDCDVVIEPSLYGSGADAAVQVAAEQKAVESLMLVGHQPTWSILVFVLTGEQVEMKTATVAVIEFDIAEWSEVPAARGEVADVFRPGDYLS